MSDHTFDDALLSGYLDGELTQQDDQRVRLHLEACASCQTTVEQMTALREATMTSEFKTPEDTQWDEVPRGALSRILTTSGWLIAGLWLAGVIGYAIWQASNDSVSLSFEGLLAVGIFLAIGLVFLSALVDRLKIRKNDPYRKVQK